MCSTHTWCCEGANSVILRRGQCVSHPSGTGVLVTFTKRHLVQVGNVFCQKGGVPHMSPSPQ